MKCRKILDLKCFKLLFKRFIKQVPGFRSGEKTNMIIASTYYSIHIILMILAVIFLNGNTENGVLKALGQSMLLPILIFYLAGFLNSRS